MRLTREQLYDLVWSEPMIKAAKRFGLSDVGLKKICIKNAVPVPSRGYWRKLEVGQKVKRAALPKMPSHGDVVISVREVSDEVQRIQNSDAVREQVKMEGQEKIVVAEVLEKPHPLTKLVRQNLRPPRDDRYGALICRGQNVPDVRVSPTTMDRALRLLDAFFKALTARRFEFKPGANEHYCMGIVIHGEVISFSLDERLRQEPHRLTDKERQTKERGGYIYPPTYDYIPSSELTIKIGGAWNSGLQSQWKDTSSAKLEEKLGDLIIGLVKNAEWQRNARLQREEAARLREEENARRDARIRLQEDEAKAVGKLTKDAGSWHQAQQLRAYIEAVERCGIRPDGNGLEGQSLPDWIEWAKRQADRLDPLTESPSSILDEKMPPLVRY